MATPELRQRVVNDSHGAEKGSIYAENMHTYESGPEKPAQQPIRHTRGDLVICVLLYAVSLAVRLFYISSPPEVVFDEVHFGKFAAYYLRREVRAH